MSNACIAVLLPLAIRAMFFCYHDDTQIQICGGHPKVQEKTFFNLRYESRSAPMMTGCYHVLI